MSSVTYCVTRLQAARSCVPEPAPSGDRGPASPVYSIVWSYMGTWVNQVWFRHPRWSQISGKRIDTTHRDQQLRDWTNEEGAVHEVWNNCGVDGNKNISILFDIDRILNANVGNTPTQAWPPPPFLKIWLKFRETFKWKTASFRFRRMSINLFVNLKQLFNGKQDFSQTNA